MIAYGKFPMCLRCYGEAWDAGRNSILEKSLQTENALKNNIREIRWKLGNLLNQQATEAANRKDYKTSDQIRAELISLGFEIKGRTLIDTTKIY